MVVNHIHSNLNKVANNQNKPVQVRHNIMTTKKTMEDEEDFDEPADDSFDEYEEMEFKKTPHKHTSNARRRHEQLKEDRALEQLLYGDFDDYSEFDDLYY